MLQGIVLLNMPAIYLQPIITPDELSSASSIMHHIRGGKYMKAVPVVPDEEHRGLEKYVSQLT